MKVVIFAGGVGKRLWPLSRKSFPKQFQKLFANETTLENSYKTIKDLFSPEDIYISTNSDYADYVFDVIPNLPNENLIIEPEARDTGAAVAYAALKIAEKFPHEPMVIRWQNSLIKNPHKFQQLLKSANEMFMQGMVNLIYLGVPSKYPNTGVGYIQLGKQLINHSDDTAVFDFLGFKEKPDLLTAKHYQDQGGYVWNPGCYITTPAYVLDQLSKVNPEFFSHIQKIKDSVDEHSLSEAFTDIPKKSIDYVLWEKLSPEGIKVIVGDYDWHYVSTWSELKHALQVQPESNVVEGNVIVKDSFNSLIYNYSKDKLVTVIGVEGINIVQTDDAILVCSSKDAALVKELVTELEQDSERLKYL